MKDPKLHIEPYFLHKNLCHGVLPRASQKMLEMELQAYEQSSSPSKRMFAVQAYVEFLVRHLARTRLPSIEEKLLTAQIKEGDLIWTVKTFQFKGVYNAMRQLDEGKDPSYAQFYTIKSSIDEPKIFGQFNVTHLHTTSSTEMLSGRSRKHIIGFVQRIQGDDIQIRPILIGNIYYKIGSLPIPIHSILECLPEDIKEFKDIKKVSRKSVDPYLFLNKQIEEKRMKEWIAEIIGTKDVPKDWGGEKCDLVLPVEVNGRRMRAAFLLKGPARFEELKIKHLGKQGDQLVRLYEESADIYIIVHCHAISSAVRKNMEIFSAHLDRPSHFCIIDGCDALRLWKAYKKLDKSMFKSL